eukprot:c4638_g1_i1.p1 GENE.c4638_g1_i1~~c4638_g1_i1.p1  ORF type:complete len:211 (-),score=38.24 c4638_g1_i1:124-732(-)
MRVAFVHPNLGIGGAERLVVDAALALLERGHTVHIFTAHHDPSHAFPETTDGTIPVSVLGSFIPPNLFGMFFVVMAILRMLWISLVIVFFHNQYDIVFVDQVSACVPLLRLSRAKIVFYCHFPDLLLTDRKTTQKRMYRSVVDYVEEKTTGMAHLVMVNSQFTAKVFKETFKSLSINPQVSVRIYYFICESRDVCCSSCGAM